MLSKCIPSPLHPRVSLQTIWSKGWEQMAPGCIFSGCLVWPTQACKQRDKSVEPAQHNSSLSQHPGRRFGLPAALCPGWMKELADQENYSPERNNAQRLTVQTATKCSVQM